MDSDARAGAALSLIKILNVPIRFLGTGEKIGSIDEFYPERITDRILGLGDILTLSEKAYNVIDEKDVKRSMARMFSGKFDLDDMLSQIEQMDKIVYIDDGKIVAVGTHEELLKTCPSYEAMAELQKLEAEK
jgi:signal recognition particle subunit SRP54